jgi:hypothetical protein
LITAVGPLAVTVHSPVVAHRVAGERESLNPLGVHAVCADLLIRTHHLCEPVYAVLSVSEIILESRRLSCKLEVLFAGSVQLILEPSDLCLLVLFRP